MSTDTKPILVHERPLALASSIDAPNGWIDAVSQKVNGWGIISAEQHRVTAIRNNDLVFFAPAGFDAEIAAPLDAETKAQALSKAIEWCRMHVALNTPTPENQHTIVFNHLRCTTFALRGSPKEIRHLLINSQEILGTVNAVDALDAVNRWRQLAEQGKAGFQHGEAPASSSPVDA